MWIDVFCVAGMNEGVNETLLRASVDDGPRSRGDIIYGMADIDCKGVDVRLATPLRAHTNFHRTRTRRLIIWEVRYGWPR